MPTTNRAFDSAGISTGSDRYTSDRSAITSARYVGTSTMVASQTVSCSRPASASSTPSDTSSGDRRATEERVALGGRGDEPGREDRILLVPCRGPHDVAAVGVQRATHPRSTPRGQHREEGVLRSPATRSSDRPTSTRRRAATAVRRSRDRARSPRRWPRSSRPRHRLQRSREVHGHSLPMRAPPSESYRHRHRARASPLRPRRSRGRRRCDHRQ